MLLRDVVNRHATGDHDAALVTAANAAAIAERFADADLHALAVHEQGLCLIRLGRVADGLRMLDEAMVAAVGGELSPIVTGLVYCSVIDGCQEIYALRRAQEWTAALSHWCDEQPDMVAFTGRCLVHRAEILQMRGAWQDALDEARAPGRPRAAEPRAPVRPPTVAASCIGCAASSPRPRMPTARRTATAPSRSPASRCCASRRATATRPLAAMRRTLSETADSVARIRLLPAAVEIMLAAGVQDEARAVCTELAGLAVALRERAAGRARSRRARGGRPRERGRACGPRRTEARRNELASDIGAPYEVARVAT